MTNQASRLIFELFDQFNLRVGCVRVEVRMEMFAEMI